MPFNNDSVVRHIDTAVHLPFLVEMSPVSSCVRADIRKCTDCALRGDRPCRSGGAEYVQVLLFAAPRSDKVSTCCTANRGTSDRFANIAASLSSRRLEAFTLVFDTSLWLILTPSHSGRPALQKNEARCEMRRVRAAYSTNPSGRRLQDCAVNELVQLLELSVQDGNFGNGGTRLQISRAMTEYVRSLSRQSAEMRSSAASANRSLLLTRLRTIRRRKSTWAAQVS